VRERSKATFISDSYDTTYLAITKMGNGYHLSNSSY
jgi:IS30 family transposase